MTQIKSNTDLEQSKKLAEILPPESADMWWLYITAQGKHIAMMYEEPDPHYLARMESYGIKNVAIRCWSLSALLSVLPDTISRYYKTLGWCDNDWNCAYMDEDGEIKYNSIADNPIDACVDMIIKLNELNLL